VPRRGRLIGLAAVGSQQRISSSYQNEVIARLETQFHRPFLARLAKTIFHGLASTGACWVSTPGLPHEQLCTGELDRDR
jgi:hypothetical protein